MGAVTMGLDVGQRVDPTAICVSEGEQRQREDGRNELHHVIRYLERLPLGTSYPAVATRVCAVTEGVVERAGNVTLYVDATGVGTPLVDVLRDAQVRALLVPVYFSHGDRRTVDDDGTVKLGKAWLVSRLQALLQGGRLHLPETAEARVLAKELLDYEIKIDQDANDRYGAFKVGTHDDLVTALGLATQTDPLEAASATVDPPRGSYHADRDQVRGGYGQRRRSLI